ncbi:hypothetical protein [Fluviicola sp.]|uniref:hypothetical protein n=1 Tax=Fluviicola sp. TaxID=1917219 RepID=UPI003D2A2A5C
MKEHLKLSFIGIAVWWILLLPFDYALFDWFFKLVQKVFIGFLKIVDEDLIFETDTYGTYVLVALSILLGVICSPIINRICSRYKWSSTDVLRTILASILFFFLFKYGWDKLTKVQFYAPEPNTLYTPLGKLSKDIAYWSLVGSSYPYTVALGIIEVLTALLLLFKRTRFLASLLAIVIFGQVVLINFSFDISVKLLSGSLLVFSLVYSVSFLQNWKSIFGFPTALVQSKYSRKHQVVKFGFALLVAIECTFPTLISNNWNDDRFPRLAHHGAYAVFGSRQVKQLFIHRQHYLILQNWDDEFKDYKIDTHLPDQYTSIDGEISCRWDKNQVIIQNDTFPIRRSSIKNLPLLTKSFHAFSDEFH